MPLSDIDQDSQRWPSNLAELQAREMVKVLYEFLDPRCVEDWAISFEALRKIFSSEDDITKYRTTVLEAFTKKPGKSSLLNRIVKAYFTRLMDNIQLSLACARPEQQALQALERISPAYQEGENSYLDNYDLAYLNILIICGEDTKNVRGQLTRIADIILNKILVTHGLSIPILKNFQNFVDCIKMDGWILNKRQILDLFTHCCVLAANDITKENFDRIREKQLKICKVGTVSTAAVAIAGPAPEEGKEKESPPKRWKPSQDHEALSNHVDPQAMVVDQEKEMQGLRAEIAMLQQQAAQHFEMIEGLQNRVQQQVGRESLLTEQHDTRIKALEEQKNQLQAQVTTLAEANATQVRLHQQAVHKLEQEKAELQSMLSAEKKKVGSSAVPAQQSTVVAVGAAATATADTTDATTCPVQFILSGTIHLRSRTIRAFILDPTETAVLKITPPIGQNILTTISGEEVPLLLKGEGGSHLSPRCYRALMLRHERAKAAEENKGRAVTAAATGQPITMPDEQSDDEAGDRVVAQPSVSTPANAYGVQPMLPPVTPPTASQQAAPDGWRWPSLPLPPMYKGESNWVRVVYEKPRSMGTTQYGITQGSAATRSIPLSSQNSRAFFGAVPPVTSASAPATSSQAAGNVPEEQVSSLDSTRAAVALTNLKANRKS